MHVFCHSTLRMRDAATGRFVRVARATVNDVSLHVAFVAMSLAFVAGIIVAR